MSTTPNKELDKAIAGNENRDPISGAPGAHPIGTGVGAALGACQRHCRRSNDCFPRKEGKRAMISKPAAVGAVLALMFVASGCDQTSSPPSIGRNPPSEAPPTVPLAESQATAPASSARSPGVAEATGREVGETLDDATITVKVLSALFQAPDVKVLDVKVETDKAVVQLSGFVASQAQIDKAVEVAKGVPGVREVQNKMSVKPG